MSNSGFFTHIFVTIVKKKRVPTKFQENQPNAESGKSDTRDAKRDIHVISACAKFVDTFVSLMANIEDLNLQRIKSN